VLKHQGEPVTGMHCRRLFQAVVNDSRFDNLIKENLVSLVEVSAKALVHQVNQLRQGHGLLVDRTLPTSVGPSSGNALPSRRPIDPSLEGVSDLWMCYSAWVSE